MTSQTDFVADTLTTPPAAIVFDVGGTLLETVGSPHKVALSAIEATTELDADAFASHVEHVEHVVAEWWRAGGDAAHEDLVATWSEHDGPPTTPSSVSWTDASSGLGNGAGQRGSHRSDDVGARGPIRS